MRSRIESEKKLHAATAKEKDRQLFSASEKVLNVEKQLRQAEKVQQAQAEIIEKVSLRLQSWSVEGTL